MFARFERYLLGLSAAILAASMLPANADDAKGRAFSVTWKDAGLSTPLNRVKFLGRSGWAVGDAGTVLFTRDAGATWQPGNNDTPRTLYGVHFLNENNGWAVGDGGTLLSTTDGGANWKPLPSKSRTLRSIQFVEGRGWAVGERGTLLTTTDGGATWLPPRNISLPIIGSRHLYAVHFVDLQKGWVAGDRIIAVTEDGGRTWKAQTDLAVTFFGLSFAGDGRTGWAVGDKGTILATTNGGETWQPQASNVEVALRDVQFADERTGWVVGDNGTVLRTSDAGVKWEPEASGTRVQLNSAHISGANLGWVVGDRGTVLARQAGETPWRNQRGIDVDLYEISFPDAKHGWVVGDNGFIMMTADGGRTWQRQTIGRNDDLRGVHFFSPQVGWVVGLRGGILATTDGGRTWEAQNSPVKATFGGVHFIDERNGWAVGVQGVIVATTDGGRTWVKQDSNTEQSFENLRFDKSGAGWAVGDGGLIRATKNRGATWTAQKHPAGEDVDLYHAFFLDAEHGWIVGQKGAILVTRDGGTTWTEQTSGTEKDLLHVHFANPYSGWITGKEGALLVTRNGGRNWYSQAQKNEKNPSDIYSVFLTEAHTGWIVGTKGTIMRGDPPAYAPWPVDPVVTTSRAGIDNRIDVSFAIADGDTKVKRALVSARSASAAKAAWSEPDVAKAPDKKDGRWQVTWKPAEYNIRPGDKVDYRIWIDDGGAAPLPEIQPAGFTFDPWFAQFLREYWQPIVGTVAVFSGFLLYIGAFGLVLLVAPARLAYLGSAPNIEGRPSGNLAFIWDLVSKWFVNVFFAWLSRHRRVRRAWTKLYINGQSKFDDLGKARAAFVMEPDVLDAWVARSAKKAAAALTQLDLYQQRAIYVELPVRVGEHRKMIERPNAETLRPLFAKDRAVIGIIGGGGSGKSTLACALARWALAENPDERIAPHRMIPVFIMQDTTNLVDAVTQNLRRMLGDEELPEDLVRGLMARQRLLVIIDALSEREAATQAHIEKVFGENVPINAIVITSRAEPKLYNVDRTTLFPVRLDAARVVPFIIGYLDRMDDVGPLKDGRMQLRLGERILGLAESGGQKTPLTPLLVTLFVNSAVQRGAEGLPIDDMPAAVPEVFVDYLRRLNAGPQAGGAVSEDVFIRAAQAFATASLGVNLVPQDFTPDEAAEALSKAGITTDARSMIDRMVTSGVIERRMPGGFEVLRFSLDPAAEYLAAGRKLYAMKGATREDLQNYLASLRGIEGYPQAPEGFLVAFATCYRAYRREFSLPDVPLPWERVELAVAA